MSGFTLIKQSIALDYKYIKVSRWSIFKKIQFLFLKYFLLVKHMFVKFKLNESKVLFSGNQIYYDSKYGIAGYQSMLTRHQYMAQVGGIDFKKIKVVIDCGANVGFFSLMIRSNAPKAHIFAIEPIPLIYECLQKNFTNDKNITISNVGMSENQGIAMMSFSEYDSVISKVSDKGMIKVNLDSLDHYCIKNTISLIDILKIDVETYEESVLKGAQNILGKVKYLYLEITLENNPNYTLSSIAAKLYNTGFNFQLVAYRNYSNKSEGRMTIMDCLFINTLYE